MHSYIEEMHEGVVSILDNAEKHDVPIEDILNPPASILHYFPFEFDYPSIPKTLESYIRSEGSGVALSCLDRLFRMQIPDSVAMQSLKALELEWIMKGGSNG